ncbi:MAG: hypothetical protein ACRDQ0_16920, partial [Pseudonocardia sp.]
MADRVFIHVGAPKSGTTYLQSVLWANQKDLAKERILLPGKVEFDHNLAASFVRSDHPGQRAKRTWRRMLDDINAWPGSAVLSNEWFSLTDEEHATRALEAFEGAEVHVVFTARDFVGVA